MTDNETEIKRPPLLTIMCVTTFVFSGLGIFSALFTPLFADMMEQVVHTNPLFAEADKEEFMLVIHAGWAYYLPTLLCAAGSLYGATQMWSMKKLGFHVYAISNLALLFVPTLVLKLNLANESIIFTVMFIGMYAVFLRTMK